MISKDYRGYRISKGFIRGFLGLVEVLDGEGESSGSIESFESLGAIGSIGSLGLLESLGSLGSIGLLGSLGSGVG